MPAPYSRLKPDKKPFAPVDTARKLYLKVLRVCLKMPKRYTYLVLQEMLRDAANVRRNAVGANSVYPTNAEEVQIRRNYWIHARAALKSLEGAVDDFLETPEALSYRDETTKRTKGVTMNELEEIADLIIEETKHISTTLEGEKKRFRAIK